MKKSEIKALIAAKIAGQGTNVDAGSVLPTILGEIIDGDASTVEVDDFEEFSTATAYSSGDIVRNDGKLYKFTANKSAGSWDSTKVTQTNVISILSGMIGTLANLATTEKSNLVGAINEVNEKVRVISISEDEIGEEITEERYEQIKGADILIAWNTRYYHTTPTKEIYDVLQEQLSENQIIWNIFDYEITLDKVNDEYVIGSISCLYLVSEDIMGVTHYYLKSYEL